MTPHGRVQLITCVPRNPVPSRCPLSTDSRSVFSTHSHEQCHFSTSSSPKAITHFMMIGLFNWNTTRINEEPASGEALKKRTFLFPRCISAGWHIRGEDINWICSLLLGADSRTVDQIGYRRKNKKIGRKISWIKTCRKFSASIYWNFKSQFIELIFKINFILLLTVPNNILKINQEFYREFSRNQRKT